MKLAITTYCTKSYTYAIEAQIPLCIAAIQAAGPRLSQVFFIMVGDDSENVTKSFNLYSVALKRLNIESKRIILDVTCNNNEKHQKNSNIVIAKMQNAAWNEARMLGVEAIWSLESDILPQHKTLRTLIDTVNFDDGWYDVAMNTYPNAGFLGGRGTPQHWILPTIYGDEKVIPQELQDRIKTAREKQKELQDKRIQPKDVEILEWKNLAEEINNLPPKGNIHTLNGLKWRQRGWLTDAYPGVGLGAILPTDWVGLGCTLFTRKALELASFTGYTGDGTQDLWLGWKVWQPNQVRMAVVPHALCDHVKLIRCNPEEGCEGPSQPDRMEIMHAYHEIWTEQAGHLRTHIKPWFGI